MDFIFNTGCLKEEKVKEKRDTTNFNFHHTCPLQLWVPFFIEVLSGLTKGYILDIKVALRFYHASLYIHSVFFEP